MTENRQAKSDPSPYRTPNLPARREFAGNPEFLHNMDAKITYFFVWAKSIKNTFWENLIEQLKKLFFCNHGKKTTLRSNLCMTCQLF